MKMIDAVKSTLETMTDQELLRLGKDIVLLIAFIAILEAGKKLI